MRDEGRGAREAAGIVTLMGYGDHNRAAGETALKSIRQGKPDIAPLTTKTLPFARYAEGVELLETKQAINILFDPGETVSCAK